MDSDAMDFSQHPQSGPIQSHQEQGLNVAMQNLSVNPYSHFSSPFQQPERTNPKLLDYSSMPHSDLNLHSMASQPTQHQSPNLYPNYQSPVSASGSTFEVSSTPHTAGNVQVPTLNPSAASEPIFELVPTPHVAGNVQDPVPCDSDSDIELEMNIDEDEHDDLHRYL